jgi:uroporphyrinogen III methyltransferase / synthase
MTEVRPLAGRRVLVTRTREQAAGLVDALHQRGADVVVVPMITTAVLAGPDLVAASFGRLLAAAPPRWAVFTSATAARLVFGALEVEAQRSFSVAAVGSETASALERAGVRPDIVAAPPTAAGLAAALVAQGVGGAHVWFPAAAGAGHVLQERLSEAGATVRRLDVYRSEMPTGTPALLDAALRRPIDAVTLTSSSTVKHLRQALSERTLPPTVVVACIGEQTAKAAAAAGFGGIVVASEPTATALADTLVARLGAAQPLP